MRCSIHPRYYTLLLAVIMVTTGTLNTVSRKISFQMEGTNITGGKETYNKAWITTFFMFLGESICLAIYFIQRACLKRKKQAPALMKPADRGVSRQELSSNTTFMSDVNSISIYLDTEDCTQTNLTNVTVLTEPPQKPAPKPSMTGDMPFCKFLLMVACFSILDIIQSTAFNISILYIPASISQILRGFSTVFCLVLEIPLMKRRPMAWEIMGVSFAFVGLTLVGITATIQEADLSVYGSTLTTVIGVVLVIIGQLFSATQFLMEERLLKQYDVNPLVVVGWEGICGMVVALCIACPLAHLIPGDDHGSLENYSNAMYMSFMNANIAAMNFLYVVSILFFNWSSLTVSKRLTSTHRSLFANLPVVLIWIIMVIVYYATQSYAKPYGEPLTPYSVLELLGFGIIFLGVVIHNNINKFGEKATCSKGTIITYRILE